MLEQERDLKGQTEKDLRCSDLILVISAESARAWTTLSSVQISRKGAAIFSFAMRASKRIEW
jgi:hypothetical protein